MYPSIFAAAAPAFSRWLADVAVLAGELPQREHRPPVGAGEGGHGALLGGGHRQDQVGARDDLRVLAKIRRDDRRLAEVDALLAQNDPRVERGDHTVARDIADTARGDADPVAHAPLLEHPRQEHLRHHAAAGVRVADEEDRPHASSHGNCHARTPWPSSRHSPAGRSWRLLPKSVPGRSLRLRPRVEGKSVTSVASAKSVTEPKLGAAAPPALTISSTTCSAGRRSPPSPARLAPRSLTTTLAPACASARAMPRPMPRPAPVTRAALPSRRPMLTPVAAGSTGSLPSSTPPAPCGTP